MASKPLDAYAYYKECIDKWGQAHLPAYNEIRFTFEDNMTSTLGRAFPKRFHHHGHSKVISRDYYAVTISYNYFVGLVQLCGPEVAVQQLRHTIIHELCHIATYHTYREHGVNAAPHGAYWRAFMIQMGLEPVARAWYSSDRIVPGTDVEWPDVRRVGSTASFA